MKPDIDVEAIADEHVRNFSDGIGWRDLAKAIFDREKRGLFAGETENYFSPLGTSFEVEDCYFWEKERGGDIVWTVRVYLDDEIPLKHVAHRKVILKKPIPKFSRILKTLISRISN